LSYFDVEQFALRPCLACDVAKGTVCGAFLAVLATIPVQSASQPLSFIADSVLLPYDPMALEAIANLRALPHKRSKETQIV
jgi:hypothetical protein